VRLKLCSVSEVGTSAPWALQRLIGVYSSQVLTISSQYWAL
jgi:hypothetical protein